MRTGPRPAGIMWGLFFCLTACLGGLLALGVPLSLTALGIIIPALLILVGVTGIALGRRRQ